MVEKSVMWILHPVFEWFIYSIITLMLVVQVAQWCYAVLVNKGSRVRFPRDIFFSSWILLWHFVSPPLTSLNKRFYFYKRPFLCFHRKVATPVIFYLQTYWKQLFVLHSLIWNQSLLIFIKILTQNITPSLLICQLLVFMKTRV